MTLNLALYGIWLLVMWLISLYFHPFGRCWRCRSRGVIIRGKPKVRNRGRKVRPPRPVICPACKGARRRQRAGSRVFHQLARRVRREIARQRAARNNLPRQIEE